MFHIWGWILTTLGVVGIYVVGTGRRWGWLFCFGDEIVWTVYAIQTHQLGFVPGNIIYGAVLLRNYQKAKKTP